MTCRLPVGQAGQGRAGQGPLALCQSNVLPASLQYQSLPFIGGLWSGMFPAVCATCGITNPCGVTYGCCSALLPARCKTACITEQ